MSKQFVKNLKSQLNVFHVQEFVRPRKLHSGMPYGISPSFLTLLIAHFKVSRGLTALWAGAGESREVFEL
jgi:hypothetical protein